MSQSGNNRIPQLDGLRAIAVLAVFFFHANNAPLLWMGVDLFFVLSGFLITGILLRLKESPNQGYFSTFYARRVRRILPPYCMFLIAASLYYNIAWAKVWYWYTFFGANIAEVLHHGAGGFMTHLWSLAVEEQFYLFWPVVVLLASRKTLTRVAWTAVLAAPIIRALVGLIPQLDRPAYFLTVCRMDLLCAGGLIALAWTNDSARFARWKPKAAAVVAFAFLGFIGMAVAGVRTSQNTIFFNSVGYSLSTIMFAATLIFALPLQSGPVHAILTNRLVRYIGQVSYMYYLTHKLFLELVARFIRNEAVMTVVTLAVTLGACALSWELVESRILNMRSVSRQAAKPRVQVAAAVAGTQRSSETA